MAQGRPSPPTTIPARLFASMLSVDDRMLTEVTESVRFPIALTGKYDARQFAAGNGRYANDGRRFLK